MQDPGSKYPKPPFEHQKQEWPGLALKMHPRPDHGEGSYKGSGRLAGLKALITGGDSGMGRAAAIAFAREGADVAINYYPTEEPDALEVLDWIRKAGRKAVALPGDLRDESFCTKLVTDAIAALANAYARAAVGADAPNPAPYPVQRGLTQAMREAAVKANDASAMQAWAGQAAGRAQAKPAGEIARDLWEGAKALL